MHHLRAPARHNGVMAELPYEIPTLPLFSDTDLVAGELAPLDLTPVDLTPVDLTPLDAAAANRGVAVASRTVEAPPAVGTEPDPRK